MTAPVDMHVQQVDSAGRGVVALSGDARSIANSFLSTVTDAEGTVVHPRLTAALARYHAAWSTPTNELAHAVGQLGADISGAAADVANADAEATAAARSVVSTAGPLAARLNSGPVL